MIEYKDYGLITIDKTKKKKVKCFKYDCKPLNRQLIIHEDIDHTGVTNLSDLATGYKLFGLSIAPDKVKIADIEEKLEKYISHFTVDGIKEELSKVELLTAGK